MQKILSVIFGLVFMFTITACDTGQQQEQDSNTQEEIIEQDTVGVEYEVETKTRETEIDTTTETETVERDLEGGQQNQEDTSEEDQTFPQNN